SAPATFRSPITTLAPSAASRRAIAAPIPLAPPVTSAVRPSSLMGGAAYAAARWRNRSRSSEEPARSVGVWHCGSPGPANRWRSAGRQGAGGEDRRARPRPPRGERRWVGDGADRRAADAALDLDQRALQIACGDPDHRAARGRPLGVGRDPRRSLMRIALLAGGTGGAKLAAGIQELVGDGLAVIANTADDTRAHGLHVSPDPALITYWLAGEIDEER